MNWQTVETCPACLSDRSQDAGHIAATRYGFGNERIALPEGGIALSRCRECDLVYKRIVPKPAFLAEVFTRQAGKVWSESRDCSRELAPVLRALGRNSFDLLDVGPGNGDLLRAAAPYPGRRSAIDVVAHPGVEQWIRGELILTLLDDDSIQWEGKPYDVVTLFHVLEHLYAPARAFENMNRLLKPGGYVVIETGDVTSLWPRWFGPHEWWYAWLFEHHVFWSRKSLEGIARRSGFEVTEWRTKPQDSKATQPLAATVRDFGHLALFATSPTAYHWVARMTDRVGQPPWLPYVHDHFIAVLRKIA